MSNYKFNVNNFSIEKDERFFAYVDFIDANKIVKMLNKQEKQIEELEKEVLNLKAEIDRLNTEKR